MSAIAVTAAAGLALGVLLALLGARRRRAARTGNPQATPPRHPAAPAPASPPTTSQAPASSRPAAARPAPTAASLEMPSPEAMRLLAHELRTPLAAIIGYNELLTDGLLGPLEPRGVEAVHRIGGAAEQLRHLLDGLHELLLAPGTDPGIEIEDVALQPVATALVERLDTMAEGRGATLEAEIPPDLSALRTDRSRLAALLDLALGAAVRASPGGALHLRIDADAHGLRAEMRGSALEPGRDDLGLDHDPGGPIQTGAALRLTMAARLARSLHGAVSLLSEPAGSVLRLEVPTLPN